MAAKTATLTTVAPAFRPKVVRKVTRRVLKLAFDTPVFVKVQKAMYEGKEIKAAAGTADAQMKPATLLDVVDLTTGEEVQIVAAAVLVSVLHESYPSDSYVGRCFQLVKRKGADSKRYHLYDVDEIEDPTPKK